MTNRIKELRKANGMTLLDIAKKLGVSESTVQRYESGNIKNLKYETMVTLANILNTTPSYLMGWADRYPVTDMSYVSEAIKIAETAGVDLSEVVGFDIAPEDYNFAKKVRVYEAKRNYLIRTGQLIPGKNSSKSPSVFLGNGNFSYLSIDESNLLSYYNALNDVGKDKALEYVSDLTENKKYVDADPDPILYAAHERTDIEVTDEMRKNDDDIMSDDDF